MSWRPKDWKTNKETLIIPQGTEPQTTLCRHCAYMVAQSSYSFEAGADAMLDALKTNALIWRISGKGFLVLIPEEEVDG